MTEPEKVTSKFTWTLGGEDFTDSVRFPVLRDAQGTYSGSLDLAGAALFGAVSTRPQYVYLYAAKSGNWAQRAFWRIRERFLGIAWPTELLYGGPADINAGRDTVMEDGEPGTLYTVTWRKGE